MEQEGILHLLSTYFTDENVADGTKFLLTEDMHSAETLNLGREKSNSLLLSETLSQINKFHFIIL